MKKFILTIILLISSVFLFAQDYPKIEIDSSGNKVVVMTIAHAQKIDNNLDILKLLKLQGSECDSLNVSYIKVIDKLGNQVKLLELDNNILNGKIDSKDKQLLNLQIRLNNSVKSDSACVVQKGLDNEEIRILKKEIARQKIQKIVGFATGTAALIVSVVLLLKSL